MPDVSSSGGPQPPLCPGELGASLRKQLSALGIATEYVDGTGQSHQLEVTAAEQLIAAMDVATGAVHVSADDTVIVTRPDAQAPAPDGQLQLEGGGTLTVTGRLPRELPLGYHELVRPDHPALSVIVSPGRCVPHPSRIWGWAAQLYSCVSRDSWGCGDLADLGVLGAWSREVGADVILVNPLDAVVATAERQSSPYFPSSRQFRDPLYLRVENVPGAAALADQLPALAARARGEGRRIDRQTIAAAKLAALDILWSTVPTAGREPGFVAFRAEQGDALERFAIFETLVETYGSGWSSWPERFRDPTATAVTAFAKAHATRVTFHAWIQWLLDEQLRQAAATIPLMRDLPVGVDPNGADAWAYQDVFANAVSLGAPPDALAPDGQNWHLPPFVPEKLRAVAYRPFIAALRGVFRHAGAVRIDHVLGLFRQFWIPPGGARDGSYVQQDTEALLDILALESHRAGAYVVGEDLGTVAPGVREELIARGILRYRVFWFEDEPPARWHAQALGAITTHDLPSIGGVWSRAEHVVQRSLGRDVDVAGLEKMRSRLATGGQLAPEATTDQACLAGARLITEAGCDVAVIQLEDAVAATHRINVPGTDHHTRPENWSLPLPVPLEEIPTHRLVSEIVSAAQSARSRTTHAPDD